MDGHFIYTYSLENKYCRNVSCLCGRVQRISRNVSCLCDSVQRTSRNVSCLYGSFKERVEMCPVCVVVSKNE